MYGEKQNSIGAIISLNMKKNAKVVKLAGMKGYFIAYFNRLDFKSSLNRQLPLHYTILFRDT